MGYKNIQSLLVDATKLPAALEAKLPAGAPKISDMLVNAAGRIPAGVPDFPMEIPDLPAVPALPAMPAVPTAPAGLTRRVVTQATPTPVRRVTTTGGRGAQEETVRIITP